MEHRIHRGDISTSKMYLIRLLSWQKLLNLGIHFHEVLACQLQDHSSTTWEKEERTSDPYNGTHEALKGLDYSLVMSPPMKLTILTGYG